jgi:hypothetical protein
MCIIIEKTVWILDPFHVPDDESFSYRDWDRSGGTLEDHAEDTPSVQYGLQPQIPFYRPRI